MKTQKQTMVDFLRELIETHMQKCDQNGALCQQDPVPHIVSETFATKAGIDAIETLAGDEAGVKLTLSDDTVWRLQIEQVE